MWQWLHDHTTGEQHGQETLGNMLQMLVQQLDQLRQGRGVDE